jgi:hypothetical protein
VTSGAVAAGGAASAATLEATALGAAIASAGVALGGAALVVVAIDLAAYYLEDHSTLAPFKDKLDRALRSEFGREASVSSEERYGVSRTQEALQTFAEEVERAIKDLSNPNRTGQILVH